MFLLSVDHVGEMVNVYLFGRISMMLDGEIHCLMDIGLNVIKLRLAIHFQSHIALCIMLGRG